MANAKESARTAYRVAGEVQFFHDVRSVSCIGDVDKGWDCKYRKDQVPRGTLATGMEPIGNVDEIDFSKVSSIVVKQEENKIGVRASHWGKRSLDCAVISQESISAPGITWKVLDCSPRKA